MSTPQISVIMPVFNAVPHVRVAIESVLAQTFRDFELIVIDDDSTDGSMQIVHGFRDERIRVIHNAENCGAAKTKNLGIENARGEFIAFLDADDIALPCRLAEQTGFLHRNPHVAIAGSQITLIVENGAEAGENPKLCCAPDEIAPTLLFENCIAQSSVMLRCTALPRDPFRTEFEPAEDYDLWARLAPASSIASMEHPLVNYRVHAGGTSARKAARMKTSTRSIHLAQLERLGIEASQQQLDLHSLLAQWPLEPTKELVAQAEDWLLALHRACSKRQIYPRIAFEKVVARRWHAVCRDSWQLGCWVWKTFWRSPLRRLAPVTFAQKYAILRHAVPQTFRRSRA
jgi:Glycosyl transferase family 2